MDNKAVDDYIQKISKKFNKSVEEINADFNTKKKNAMAAYEMPDEEANQFAIDAIIGSFHAAAANNEKEFTIIFTGTDGRVSDWAKQTIKTQMAVAAEMTKKGKTEQDIIAAGLKNVAGKWLYPQNAQYNAGEVIPESDAKVNVEGLATMNGKLVPAFISSKSLDFVDVAKKRSICKVMAFVKQNSKADALQLSVKDMSKVTVVKDISNADFVKACEKAYGHFVGSFDKLVQLSESITKATKFADRRFTLNKVQVLSVQTDVGANKSYILTVQMSNVVDMMGNPNFEKYSTISVWLPKQLGFVPYQYQMINVHGMAGEPDKERGQLVLNAMSVWCDDKFIMKNPPKLPDEPAKAAAPAANNKAW